MPGAAASYLPKVAQLYREDYHVQRSYSSPLRTRSSGDEDEIFMAEKTAREKKKSPFTFLPHPLRLVNRTSLSLGPTLPFSCIYASGRCNDDYEEARKRRWELLKPGDHLRIRIAEVRKPAALREVSPPQAKENEEEEEKLKVTGRKEERQRRQDGVNEQVPNSDDEEKEAHRDRPARPLVTSSSLGLTGEADEEEEELGGGRTAAREECKEEKGRRRRRHRPKVCFRSRGPS